MHGCVCSRARTYTHSSTLSRSVRLFNGLLSWIWSYIRFAWERQTKVLLRFANEPQLSKICSTFPFFLRVLSLTLSCTRSLILSSLIFSFFSISWRRIHFVSIFDNAHIHRTIYLMCKSVLMMLRSFGRVLSKFSSERVRSHLFHMRGYRFRRIRALHSECNRAYVLCTYNWSIELVSVYSWASFSSYLSPPPGLFSLWIILWTVNTHTHREIELNNEMMKKRNSKHEITVVLFFAFLLLK